ncbi:TGFB1 factor, partial [Spelaeornis formosus]|nr:TGFB1 factor [Elachura formosa]
QRPRCPQAVGNASWRFLQGRSVRITSEDEWLWFDVTDSVRQWLRGSEALGVFRLSAHCPCDGDGDGDGDSALRIHIEGNGHRGHGDLGDLGDLGEFV